ncbi:MAG: amino acid permease, partial [Chloroflexi bacterium]|nr:amino acid permease [Chloroflexota bacterium]
VAAVEAGRLDALAPVVRLGAVLATLSVLLSLLAGVGRTAFAMAANGDLPRALDAVHPRFRTPHVAEIIAAAIVGGAVALFDVRGAIGFSSATVLTYYAVTNASALTLPGGRSPAWLAGVIGLIGCVTLAVMLPPASVIGGALVLASGMVVWFVKERLGPGDGAATR